MNVLAFRGIGGGHRIKCSLTRKRQPEEREHYTDIICRMDPEGMQNQFYRVRLWEMPPDAVADHTNCVALNVFKCTPDRGALGTEA